MNFKDRLETIKPGDTLKNSDLIEVFECQHQGGMRKSNKNNCLVLVSDNTNPLYKNHWIGNILHYTGMGQKGDQDVDYLQNKTLNNSRETGTRLFIFEVFNKGEYVYAGEGECLGDYKIERQLDVDGRERNVVVFPIKLIDDYALDRDKLKESSNKVKRNIEKVEDQELEHTLERFKHRRPSKRIVKSTEYDRNPYVVEYATRRAEGVCELCEEVAPFNDKKGNPYLEVHHIEYLSEGGEDSIENTAALCPNCHKKIHIREDVEDTEKLKKLRKKYNNYKPN